MHPEVEAALARIAQYNDAPMLEQRDAITDELCYLTGSTISYFAAMNPAEDVLTMIGWSKSAMGDCGLIRKPLVYWLQDTGLWGDAVRERRPVITNDYQSLVKPTKKGYPQGHVHVIRHMNLPIYDGDRVALVVGVGNKPTPYTMDDARLVEELMTEAWYGFQHALWEATW